MEAQILQWQSAYVSKDDNKGSGLPRREGATGANSAPLGNTSRLDTASPSIGPTSRSTPTNDKDNAQKTVLRAGGGTTWADSTLLEWNPAHFRLFVGNLAGEVTDESLLKAFSKYPSVQKARVVRDKRTTKSKGYGFVSFSDGDEYFAAGRDMQGKYIGSHPVLLKRSNTEVRPAVVEQGGNKGGKHGKGGKGGGGGAGGHGKVEHGGVGKKQPKMKGRLKVLG
jgi:RNA recognition motif. (a.k.a. RRM, RBD, or RNP domain)